MMAIVAISPAGASGTLTVSPRTGLVDGQSVTVGGQGFAANAHASVIECVASTSSVTGCDTSTQVFFLTDASGNFSLSFSVRHNIVVNGNQIDCTVSTNACLLGAGTSVAGDSAAVRISFASVIPKIEVTPNTNLTGASQSVTVVGSGFTPLAQIDLAQCLTGATSQRDCDLTSTLVTTTTSASGTFTVSFLAKRSITVNNNNTACDEPTSCVIGAGTSLTETATTSISFIRPTITVTPNTNVVDTQVVVGGHVVSGGDVATVTVRGADFSPTESVGLFECAPGTTQYVAGDGPCTPDALQGVTTDGSGGFSVSLQVQVYGTLGVGPEDCRAPNACVVFAVNTSVPPTEVASATISFTDPASCAIPYYDGEWSGTWQSTTTQGLTGTWSVDITSWTTTPAGGVVGATYAPIPVGTMSMTETAPTSHTLVAAEPISEGYTICEPTSGRSIDVAAAPQVSPDFSFALSPDGLGVASGAYAFVSGGDTGTLSGALAAASAQPAARLCPRKKVCATSISRVATRSAPAETITVVGTPTGPNATINISTTLGTLACPGGPSGSTNVTNLTDTGFAKTSRLTVTAALHLATSTSPEQVCFHSNVPFKTQTRPEVATGGTAFLPSCATVKNVAPCVVSSKQVGTDIAVTFVTPGGDPTFTIVAPTGRLSWLSRLSAAATGAPFTARLQTKGGKSPVHWKVVSGRLPAGVSLDPNTGVISGTPTKKGSFAPVLQASDSETPPKTSSISVPIAVA